MTTSEATFFAFLFHFLCFYHFTANVTRPLPLEVIKGEAGRRQKKKDETTRQQQLEHKPPPPPLETWDLLPLSKACNPYYEHLSARQHEPQRNPLDIGPFLPEPVYILVSALHTIRV
jgi:hypothetical protein